MTFFTQESGSAASERVRIKSDGNIELGSAADPGDALRFFDVYNLNTGASAGSILRLITRHSDGATDDSTSADIVKYKAGGLIIKNNENLGTTGYISFETGTAGGSVTERLRIAGDGDLIHTGDGNVEYKMKCGTSSGNNIIAFLNSSGVTRGNITYDSDNDFLFFNVNQNERVRINSDGDLLRGGAGQDIGASFGCE